MNKFKPGDTIIWRRAEAPVEAKVLEARNGNVNLKVTGWAGETWEREASHTMWLASEWLPNATMRAEVLRRYRDGIQLSREMIFAIKES